MSDPSNANFGFGKLVPGFDFLQNLAKGAQSLPQMPTLSNWVAPTLSVEELEKRIADLKAVQFWLDQNSRALTATVQALEVQKMTLSALQGMNVSMADLAETLKTQSADAVARTRGAMESASKGMGADASSGAAASDAGAGGAAAPAASASAGLWGGQGFGFGAPPTPATPGAKPASTAAPASASPEQPDAAASSTESTEATGTAALGVDPMQWWNALTQQFQQIASSVVAESARLAPTGPDAQQATAELAKTAFQSATEAAQNFTQMAAGRPARDSLKPVAAKKTSTKAPSKNAKPAAPSKATSPRPPRKPAA